ncbi:phosphatase [Halosimplex marinum]|uniref:phosphatase n=1 Tax=Halosimplex marinum TaxID=3396620 RepID=UPI003F549756
MPGTDSRPGGPDWWRHGDAVVRPFGHRHDAPIARRIAGTELSVGNVHAADPERCDRSFDRVLSLTAEGRPATTHHRPLVDGPDNDWAAFEAAADTACRLVGERSLLVHCSHGVSRSAVVAAVALAASEERALRDALALVRSARPPATVHPSLREQAVWYLAEK